MHVTDIFGLPSNSSSPSDTYIITHKYNNVQQRAFVKTFISPNYLRENSSFKLQAMAGLYELYIYKNVTQPLVDHRISPNFVNFIGAAENCSFYQLLRLVQINGNKTNRRRNLIRNLFMMAEYDQYAEPPRSGSNSMVLTAGSGSNSMILSPQNPKENIRRAIDDDTQNVYVPPEFARKVNKYKFNLIITEPMSSPTATYASLIENMNGNDIVAKVWEILFQIAVGCYAMSLSHMVHNDLHSSNVFAVNTPPTSMCYVVDDRIYVLENQTYLMKIFDFDRAFSEALGRNTLLDGKYCDDYSQCNTYIPNLDIIKIFCYVYRRTSDVSREQVLSVLCGDESAKDQLHNLYVDLPNCWLQQSTTGKSYPVANYALFHDMSTIIRRLGARVSYRYGKIPLNVQKENIFICNATMFDNKGRILPDQVVEATNRYNQ